MLLKGIFWTNIRKHGLVRGALGGYIQYLSFPFFILFEKMVFRYLKKALLFFQVQLDINDYISYGRVNLDEYSWFDRMNCHFCAYANGTTHMISAALDSLGSQNLDDLDESEKEQVQALVHKTFSLAKPIGLIGYLIFVVIICGLLNYARPDKKGIITSLKEMNYGKGLRSEAFPLIYPDAFKLRFLYRAFQDSLAIIENNWCPLTYADKQALLPHQEAFISSGYDAVVEYILDEKKDREQGLKDKGDVDVERIVNGALEH